MNQMQAKKQIIQYLKQHFIRYEADKDKDTGADRLTMVYKNYPQTPDSIIESCIYFYDNYMETRVYYSATGAKWCKESTHKSELFRLINYINAVIWPTVSDGAGSRLYHPTSLFTPRLYMTEDGCCDITMTTIVNYDFFAVAPLETEDFLTAALPDLLHELSVPIFFALLGKMTAEEAITWMKERRMAL